MPQYPERSNIVSYTKFPNSSYSFNKQVGIHFSENIIPGFITDQDFFLEYNDSDRAFVNHQLFLSKTNEVNKKRFTTI